MVPSYADELTALMPDLRACARGLCRNTAMADDLCQETALKALRHADKFEAGTNYRGWVFTIMRNTFFTSARRRHREVADPDGFYLQRLTVAPSQEHWIELLDLRRSLQAVPPEQQQALILISEGLSYQETAEICGCPVGSVKSRVSRCRQALMRALAGDQPAEAAR